MGWIRKALEGVAGVAASTLFEKSGALGKLSDAARSLPAMMAKFGPEDYAYGSALMVKGMILLAVFLLATVVVHLMVDAVLWLWGRKARGREKLVWLLEDTADAMRALGFMTGAYRIDRYYGQYGDAAPDLLRRKIAAQCADITRLQNAYCAAADRLSGNATPSEMQHLAERLRLQLDGKL